MQANAQKVYVATNKGAIAYHKSDKCMYLRQGAKVKDLGIAEAKQMKRQPCKVCYPPAAAVKATQNAVDKVKMTTSKTVEKTNKTMDKAATKVAKTVDNANKSAENTKEKVATTMTKAADKSAKTTTKAIEKTNKTVNQAIEKNK